MTRQERAEKKVQIAIDKMIDLQQDLLIDDGSIERVLDNLRDLENKITSNGFKLRLLI